MNDTQVKQQPTTKVRIALQDLLTAKGYESVKQLAEEIDGGRSYQTLLKLANNQRNGATFAMLAKICDQLECGIEELLILEPTS